MRSWLAVVLAMAMPLAWSQNLPDPNKLPRCLRPRPVKIAAW